MDYDEDDPRSTEAYTMYRVTISGALAQLIELCNGSGMHLDAKIISSIALVLFELEDDVKLEIMQRLDKDVIPVLLERGYITENEDGTYSHTEKPLQNMETAGNC